MLRLKNITYCYPSHQKVKALDKISVDINQGETVCIVGHSGSGKSTLLSILQGLIKPTQGEVNLQKDLLDDSKISTIFQGDTLLPWATILDNVLLPLKIRKIDKKIAQSTVIKCLKMVGMENTSNLYPFQLSGGMRQKVSIARALVIKPKLLLMDEPFAAIDSLTRRELQDLISNYTKANKCTVVLVTHDLREATYLGDRVICMACQKIVKILCNPVSIYSNRKFSKKIIDFESIIENHILTPFKTLNYPVI